MPTITEEFYENGVLVGSREIDVPPEMTPNSDSQADRIAELESTVAALKDQATGKITKAQLATRLAAAKPGKG